MSAAGYQSAGYRRARPSGKDGTAGDRYPHYFYHRLWGCSKEREAINAGAVDFFIKPFTTAKLLDAIALALKESKARNKKQAETAKIWRNIKTLSPRELEVFRLVVSGMLNKQIASKRGTALQTIKVHRARVMQKMQAKTVTELIGFAKKAGITSSLS